MARTIGLLLGSVALLDGLIGALNPRWGFGFWQRNIRPHLPETLNRHVDEYARLSDPAIRYIAYWQMTIAGVVLWLASKARD